MASVKILHKKMQLHIMTTIIKPQYVMHNVQKVSMFVYLVLHIVTAAL